MREFTRWVGDEFGSAEEYLINYLGWTDQEVSLLKDKLTGQES